VAAAGGTVVVAAGNVVVAAGKVVVAAGKVVVVGGGGAARTTLKYPVKAEVPSRTTNAKATVRINGEGLLPTMTWAVKLDVHGRTLLAYTTGKDWWDSSSSWQELACISVPVTDTSPP
jgi:hypothetical protein